MEWFLALVISATCVPRDAPALHADRERLTQEDLGHTFYLSLEHLPADQARDCAAAVKLMVASTTLQPIVERQRPRSVAPRLGAIDLRDLGWQRGDFDQVLADYPYFDVKAYGTPALIRADWLVVKLADATTSDAYYRLLFGGEEIPKTRDEWLERLGVSTKSGPDGEQFYNFGMIEGASQVSKQKIRVIENRPVQRGYAWGTRDVFQLQTANDPLEHLRLDYEHDGEEWIVGVPKRSVSTGETGALQVYLLAAGDGQRVDAAPIALVEDYTTFRGLREIRNPGSCVQCHAVGINDPTRHELRELVKSGVDVYAGDKELALEIEAYHLAQLTREIGRNNEDFATGVRLVTGLASEEASAAVKRCVDEYDAPVDLARAARELYVAEEELRQALAFASARGVNLGARVASLAHGGRLSRPAWEERYLEVKSYVRTWRE